MLVISLYHKWQLHSAFCVWCPPCVMVKATLSLLLCVMFSMCVITMQSFNSYLSKNNQKGKKKILLPIPHFWHCCDQCFCTFFITHHVHLTRHNFFITHHVNSTGHNQLKSMQLSMSFFFSFLTTYYIFVTLELDRQTRTGVNRSTSIRATIILSLKATTWTDSHTLIVT